MEALLGGLVGLGGVLAQNSWQQQAMVNDIENSRWQRRMGEKQFRVSTAGRSDAFGNKTSFDDLLNEWKTVLSPKQQQIATAQEAETLRSLTEDAARNRHIRERQAERGDAAAQDWVKTKAAYDFTRPKSELALRDELTGLLTGASEAQANKEAALNARQSIRQGGNIEKFYQNAATDIGSSLPVNLLKARQGAAGEKQALDAAHESMYRPRLSDLVALMDAGGNADIKFTDIAGPGIAQQGDMAKLTQQALQNAAQNNQLASAQMSKTLNSGGPDSALLGSIMRAFGSPGAGGRPRTKVPTGASASSINDTDNTLGTLTGGGGWNFF